MQTRNDMTNFERSRAHAQSSTKKVFAYTSSDSEENGEFIDNDFNLGHEKHKLDESEKHWRPGSTDDKPPATYS